MKKVKGKQNTYKHKGWLVKVPRRGSSLFKELERAAKAIKSGKVKYKKLEL